MTARFADHLVHCSTLAARDALTSVPTGALAAVDEDHGIYQWDGTLWQPWRDPVGDGTLAGLSDVDTTSLADGDTLVWNAGTSTWQPGTPSSGGGTGGILASTAYNPGTITSYSIASGTLTDVDATNLAVTFEAPASGNVLVRLSALTTVPAAQTLYWGLREGSSQVGSPAYLSNAPASDLRFSPAFIITGLVAGSSHTYKWAQKVSGGAGVTYAGGAAGQSVMEVHAL